MLLEEPRLPSALGEILVQLYEARQLTKTGVAPPPKASEHIFLNAAGRPWRDNLLTRFKRCCRLAGIENSYRREDGMEVVVDTHSLRMTFASILLERGADEKAVQVLMQHTDINLTRNIYQKVRDGNLRAALGRLAGDKYVTEVTPLGPNPKGGEAVTP
ncbi:MAG: tyrosine-type recombinase/integrase [Planctomycetota bacterium]|jgi:site-specific recombinase XerD